MALGNESGGFLLLAVHTADVLCSGQPLSKPSKAMNCTGQDIQQEASIRARESVPSGASLGVPLATLGSRRETKRD